MLRMRSAEVSKTGAAEALGELAREKVELFMSFSSLVFPFPNPAGAQGDTTACGGYRHHNRAPKCIR